MKTAKQSVRLWWQKPRRFGDHEEDRRVTFLELFYDLVYVVVIAELAHALAAHVGLAGLGEFAFLFTLIWWAWINGTLYHDYHGNNDIRTRVFTFGQMFCVAGMAVFAHGALGSGATGFAICYGSFLLILTVLWWRSGVHDPNHQPLSKPYSLLFLLASLAFFGSVFVPEPWRYILWGATNLPTMLMPFYLTRIRRKAGDAEAITNTHSSVIERFGLFTIIVLGEVIVGVVQGVAGHHHLTWTVGSTAGLGMLVAVGLWWLYFDSISHRRPKPSLGVETTWMYLHLPVTIGIAATGAAVLNVIETSGQILDPHVRWLLVGSVTLVLLSLTMLMGTVRIDNRFGAVLLMVRRVTAVSAVLVVILGISNLPIIPLLTTIVALLLAPIFYAIRLWIRTVSKEREAGDR